MARCKCRICGKSLTTESACLVITNGKKAFYCSPEEYEADEARKKKESADKDKAYRLICEIIGRKKIINTALWREWKLWNEVASDEVIAQYLEENKDYLTGVIARLDNIEYNRIRYLSAILKNKLGDYKPKVKEIKKPIVAISDEHYETKFKPKERKALDDFEEDYDE